MCRSFGITGTLPLVEYKQLFLVVSAVDHLTRAEPLDPQIAYGLSEVEPADSPWHQRFRLLRVEPFNRKRLRSIARELDFSPRTEIKKRGFPDTPEQIRGTLKLQGSTHGVIFIARQGEGHVMGFATRI